MRTPRGKSVFFQRLGGKRARLDCGAARAFVGKKENGQAELEIPDKVRRHYLSWREAVNAALNFFDQPVEGP